MNLELIWEHVLEWSQHTYSYVCSGFGSIKMEIHLSSVILEEVSSKTCLFCASAILLYENLHVPI